MIRFFPGFVGSKAFWVDDVKTLLKDIPVKERHIVELFAGSAVLSANCATTAFLVDTDEIVCRILDQYDKQIVPEEFTREMYFTYRKDTEWWKYAFCLSKMSFSSVFRYTVKNGYNVPIRQNVSTIHIRPEYLEALRRWKRLKPTVCNTSYVNIPLDALEGKIVVLDPPYAGSQASYNTKEFDYQQYWEYVQAVRQVARRVILFDRRETILTRLSLDDILFYKQKGLRPNGKYAGDIDAMVSLTTKVSNMK